MPERQPRTRRAAAAQAERLFGEMFDAPAHTAPDASGELWEFVERLQPNPYQPRLRMKPARVRRMANSLNTSGQLQAVLVRPHPTRAGHFQIAAGGTRAEAVKAGGNAGSHKDRPETYVGKLRIEIRELSDAEMLDTAFVENDEREDFTVFDLANYYSMLQELLSRAAQMPAGDMLPWEEIYALRVRANRPLPHTARSIRRIVDTFRLPAELSRRLQDLNLEKPDESADEEKFTGVSEKHVRAFLFLQPASQKDPAAPMNAAQADLLGQLELFHLSANETLRRAAALRDAQPTESEPDGSPVEPDTPSYSGITTTHRPLSNGGAPTYDSSPTPPLLRSPAEPEPLPDPIREYLHPAARAIERCRQAIIESRVRVVPPSEIEAACQEIERALTDLRKSKRQS